MTPNYTVQLVAYPVASNTNPVVGQVLVKGLGGTYVAATAQARGALRSSGVVTAQGAVNNSVFIQGFGDISNEISGLGAGTSCFVRVSEDGFLERAEPITSADDIVGSCRTDGSCQLFFGVMNASMAILSGVGTMNTTLPTTAGATGVILPTVGRVFTVELNNARNVIAYVFLYDGNIEIGRVAIPAGSTAIEPFVNGQDLTTNLNYAVSSTLDTFTADSGGMVVASCRYAPSGQASTAPILSQVNPNTGATAGNTSVVLVGVNFTGATQVLFDGIAATNLVVNSNTQVSCLTPAHAAQSVTVSIVTPNGTATLPNGFTYSDVVVAPTVTAISPTFGPIAGGTTVTITGTGFVTGATVAIGGTACTGVVVNSSTSITAVTAAHVAGNNLNVVVTNPSNLSGTLPNAFSYTGAPAPTVSAILPTSGVTTGGTPFSLTTTNAVSGATVKFDTASATSVVVVTANQVTGVTPAHGAGVANVILTNPDSQTATLPAAFTYTAPPPTIDPADYNLSVWLDFDDFNFTMQAMSGRASAGTSGTRGGSRDVGSAIVAGPTLNGHATGILANSGLLIAAQESDIFSPTSFTTFAVMKVNAINPASDDAALFYTREQCGPSVQVGGGVYTALSADGNISITEFNGGFTTPPAAVAVTIPNTDYILLITRYDGTNISIQNGSGAPDTKAFASPLTPGANPVHMGYSGSALPITNMTLACVMVSPSYFNNTDVSSFITYFNTRYGKTF